jgi:hypothetical protein
MQRCPACERDFPDDLDRCPTCGDPDGEERSCARCGTGYIGSDACPVCGTLGAGTGCATHSDRTAGGRCVACGRALCQSCRASDRHAWLCQDHRGIVVIEGWAQVYSTTSEFEAQLLRENLRAEGVDARIFSQRDNILSVEIGDLSIVRLLVPVWEYELAARVIHEHMDTEGEVSFACPSCGEPFDPGAGACADCGTPFARGSRAVDSRRG